MDAVIEDRDLLGGPGRLELTPLLGIPGRDGQGRAGGRAGPARHGDPATHERSEHREEPAAGVLDGGGVDPVLVDVAVSVEEVGARHPDVVEGEPAVVDTGEAGLAAAVADRHARHRPAAIITDRHEDAVDAVAALVGHELGKDRRHPGVAGGVADVVLAAHDRRSVDDELVRGPVVGRGRQQVLDVGAVPRLAHREAAGDAEVEHRREMVVEVALGAEVGDRPGIQTELDAGLHPQREVGVTEHLEGRYRGAEVA